MEGKKERDNCQLEIAAAVFTSSPSILRVIPWWSDWLGNDQRLRKGLPEHVRYIAPSRPRNAGNLVERIPPLLANFVKRNAYWIYRSEFPIPVIIRATRGR